jgi:glucose-6-phosphate isomerase
MLRIDCSNLEAKAVGDENGLTKSDIDAVAQATPRGHDQIQKWRKSEDAIFYDVVADDSQLAGIAEKASEVAESFDDVVVLGIGGSSLGLRCAAQALLPPFWNLKTRAERKNHPRLFVCDNIDPETISGLFNWLDMKRTCFTVISKSGGTTETASQMLLAIERLKGQLGDVWKKHLVAITDPKSGHLKELADKEGLHTFAIPPKLGGRFSVLSPVGLFPAACVGIDVKNLIGGAREMAARCGEPVLETNPAYQVGGYNFWMDTKKGKNMSVMLPYSDALMLTADWYSQLWAESLGKDGKGQTPVKALGATDQHSQVQLYMEGPADKVFTFVGTDSFRTPKESTTIDEAKGAYEYLLGKDLGTIINAERQATAEALAKQGRPSLQVTFPTIDAHHLGEFFMLYETATAFAGALYEINPFNQPGVELGKKITREILTKG